MIAENSRSYGAFAGWCAILAGAIGFLYSIAFILLRDNLLSGLFLATGGLLSVAALLGVYSRLRQSNPEFALLAVLLGIAGALGATIHGGYDLANVLNPPATGLSDLPNAVDPRGLLTFGISGIALLLIAWLMRRAADFPAGLGILGYVLAFLLIWIYLGRLIVLDPTNVGLAAPALVAGFLVNPIWYVWTGLALRRHPAR